MGWWRGLIFWLLFRGYPFDFLIFARVFSIPQFVFLFLWILINGYSYVRQRTVGRGSLEILKKAYRYPRIME